jgi:hypothetical protein
MGEPEEVRTGVLDGDRNDEVEVVELSSEEVIRSSEQTRSTVVVDLVALLEWMRVVLVP